MPTTIATSECPHCYCLLRCILYLRFDRSLTSETSFTERLTKLALTAAYHHWVSNHIHINLVDVITHPCPNFSNNCYKQTVCSPLFFTKEHCKLIYHWWPDNNIRCKQFIISSNPILFLIFTRIFINWLCVVVRDAGHTDHPNHFSGVLSFPHFMSIVLWCPCGWKSFWSKWHTIHVAIPGGVEFACQSVVNPPEKKCKING